MISGKLREEFEKAKAVCVLTGAGISVESGIPAFRSGGMSAVWKGMPFEKISSARMIKEDLDAVWEWFDYRRGIYKNCQPNPAHFALAEWQYQFDDFTLITQNVDGLHERAGSKDILELHGNINRSRCENCGGIYVMNTEDIPHKPLDCESCRTTLRPDVVLFGEMLPAEIFQKAAQRSRKCDLFFTVGTSALVYPAAGFAEIARLAGARLVEINPEETPLTPFCDFYLKGKAGDILPEFIQKPLAIN